MTDKTTKEKVTDFLLAIIGMALIFTCLAMLPRACDTEAKMREERTQQFLSE